MLAERVFEGFRSRGHPHLPPSARFIGAIDLGPVVDCEDGDVVVVDAVHDPEVTTSGTVETFQLESQGFTDPLGVRGQRAVDELDHCRPDPTRKPLEGTLGRRAPSDQVGLLIHGRAA